MKTPATDVDRASRGVKPPSDLVEHHNEPRRLLQEWHAPAGGGLIGQRVPCKAPQPRSDKFQAEKMKLGKQPFERQDARIAARNLTKTLDRKPDRRFQALQQFSTAISERANAAISARKIPLSLTVM